MRIDRLSFLFPLVVTAVALSGCSDAEPASIPSGYMNLAGVQAEYDSTVENFPYPLPDGVDFPTRAQEPAATDQPTIYQKGSGLDQTYQFWECAWQDQALRSQGTDQDAAGKALDMLEQGLTSIYRTQYVVDTDGVWKNTLDKAKLGDLSALGEFYTSDCIWYRAETGQ